MAKSIGFVKQFREDIQCGGPNHWCVFLPIVSICESTKHVDASGKGEDAPFIHSIYKNWLDKHLNLNTVSGIGSFTPLKASRLVQGMWNMLCDTNSFVFR